jgi:hypothetical protein
MKFVVSCFAQAKLLETARRTSMPGKGFVKPILPESPYVERPAAMARRSVRFSILNWTQLGFLATVVGALAVLTSDARPNNEAAPAWSARTGHPGGVFAVALAPDGRKLATGGRKRTWSSGR